MTVRLPKRIKDKLVTGSEVREWLRLALLLVGGICTVVFGVGEVKSTVKTTNIQLRTLSNAVDRLTSKLDMIEKEGNQRDKDIARLKAIHERDMK